MRAMVSFLELEPEREEEESEDLEQPVKRAIRARAKAIVQRPLTPTLSPSDGERENISDAGATPRCSDVLMRGVRVRVGLS
jgi:hypothetical protein